MDATAKQLLARLRQDPTDGATLSALREHCERMGDYATLVEALEHRARALAAEGGDPIELGRMHFDLGNLFRRRLGRVDRAIVHYRTAIDFDAAQRPAMAAARAVYSDLGKWDQVVKLLSLEAESLPAGEKRATTLIELARVYREHLGQPTLAATALREAAAADPGDLQVRHDLATMLLDQADQAERDADSERADLERREAADVLCEMANAVSDDYAFAYVEAALDAVPDHGRGLSMLEQVAPRVGRADTIPPRWVAGLQMAPLGPLSRELRLKLATAYRDVGQVDDARASLEPLVQGQDAEAQALAASLFTGRGGARPAPTLLLPVQIPEGAADLAGPTGEVQLDELEPVDTSIASSGFAEELAELASREDETGSTPAQSLDDLAIVRSGAPADVDEPLDMLSSMETQLPREDSAVEGAEGALAVPEDEHDDDAALRDEATRPRAAYDDFAGTRAQGAWAAGGVAPSEPAAGFPTDQDALTSNQPTVPHNPVPTRPGNEASESGRSPTSELDKLRLELEKKQKFRDLRGAAEVGDAILALDGTDSNAIAALEDHYRASRDFRRLRELALRIGREPAMAVETRIARLREAGMLSESKLGDVEGTVVAWTTLLALSPHDEEITLKLRKLLTRLQRWDALVEVLDRRAAALPDPAERAALYREIAALHRDQRQRADDAIEALCTARDLWPDAATDDAVLSALFLAAERYAEAATSFEARLARASADNEKLECLATLGELYEIRLADGERAFEVSAQRLRLAPGDATAFDRMERIDERQERYGRLIDTLVARSGSTEGRGRAALLARAAELAREKLANPVRATELYAEALAFAPGDVALVTAAEAAFDEAERGAVLTDMLKAQAAQTPDPEKRLSLLRKVATRLAADGDVEAAIAAHETVISISVDVPTLRSLVALLERSEGHETDLAAHLDTLAGRVAAPEARDLRLARAALLASKINDPEAAKNELRTLLSAHSGDDLRALEMLAKLGTDTDDHACLAEAQEQLLARATDPEARIGLARSLADLYEGPLSDGARAISALSAWAALDVSNPQAHLRLAPLLEAEGKFAELLPTLDTLATLSIADDEAAEFLLRAAKVAMHELGDHEGAWQRLVPRVVDAGDPAAEETLRELAKLAGRGEQLGELFVGLAQRGDDEKAQTRRWMDAAYVYEMMVGSTEKALEAALRALAKEMGNLALLDEVDRLAAAAGAWPRLAQVYDAMTRRGTTPTARVRPLLRHAALLEHKARDVSAAFDRVALAFSLDPAADDVYAEVRRLGHLADRTEDVLLAHERRAGSASGPAQRIAALIEASRLALHVLEDAPRATGNLSRAVGLAALDPAGLDDIERVVKELDRQQPPLDGRGLTRALCEVYQQRGEDAQRDPKLAAELMRRAAILLETDQDDVAAAYRALAKAATLTPTDEALLDALMAVATRANELDALALHLQTVAGDAIDSATASAALGRLAQLYEVKPIAPAKMAEVYRQLIVLRPHDLGVADKLRDSLHASGQFKELLVAIERQLSLVTDESARRPLLEQAAQTWESGLSNRFEARDAWKRVLSLYPDSAPAIRAIKRLAAKAHPDDSELLERDLVVGPDDLRPSSVPQPSPAPDAVVPATIVGVSVAPSSLEPVRSPAPSPAPDAVVPAAIVAVSVAPAYIAPIPSDRARPDSTETEPCAFAEPAAKPAALPSVTATLRPSAAAGTDPEKRADATLKGWPGDADAPPGEEEPHGAEGEAGDPGDTERPLGGSDAPGARAWDLEHAHTTVAPHGPATEPSPPPEGLEPAAPRLAEPWAASLAPRLAPPETAKVVGEKPRNAMAAGIAAVVGPALRALRAELSSAPASRPPPTEAAQLPANRPPPIEGAQLPANRPPPIEAAQLPSNRPPPVEGAQLPANRPPPVEGVQLPANRPPSVEGAQLPANRPPPVEAAQLPASRPPAVEGAQLPANRPPPGESDADAPAGGDRAATGLDALTDMLERGAIRTTPPTKGRVPPPPPGTATVAPRAPATPPAATGGRADVPSPSGAPGAGSAGTGRSARGSVPPPPPPPPRRRSS